MLLKKARICNYHSFEEVNIVFELFSALVGPNNIGKSSVLQALEYIFTPAHPRNVNISKTDFYDPGKPIVVDVVLGDLNETDKAAFYHDDGLINPVNNTITIRFESSWSPDEQDVVSQCYFLRDDKPEDQQRITDFSSRYKQYLPYFIISSERSAVQEMGISKNRDLGKVLRAYSSDYLKPLQTLLSDLKSAILFIQKEKQDWPNFPSETFEKAEEILSRILSAIPADFTASLNEKETNSLDEELDNINVEWKKIESELLPFTALEAQTAYRTTLAQVVEKTPILIKRARTQLSLFELRNGMLEERKFEEMNMGFKQIFQDMIPGQTVGLNLFSIQDDDLISQISVDLDDQSVLSKGSGYQSMFVIGLKLVRMLAQIRTSGTSNIRNFVVGIEEPENHLHPHMQRHLINFVRKLQAVWKKEGYQLQVVITSHSPSIISRFSPWELILLQRESGKVNAYKWEKNLVEEMAKDLGADQDNLAKKTSKLQTFVDFFMELHTDVFFSECVIIVEGETEQGAIPIWAKKLSNPIDFDQRGICLIKPDSMQYAMKVLDTFKISHLVVYDRGDNHPVDGVSSGYLCPTQKGEFEDDLFESAKLSSLIRALHKSSFGNRSQSYASSIKNIEGCSSIEDLNDVVELVDAGKLSEASFREISKEIKKQIKNAKSLLQGKMIALETSETEIPPYIKGMFEYIQKEILQG